MIISRRLLCATLMLSILAPLPSFRANAEDNDVAEVEHYTLTMDKVHRYQNFLMDLSAFVKANPTSRDSMHDAIETDADKHEDDTAIEHRMNANPVVAGALKKNSWTAHEFIVFQAALIQAGMASAMKPASEADGEYAAKTHLNPANLVFVREHRAELEALNKSSESKQDN